MKKREYKNEQLEIFKVFAKNNYVNDLDDIIKDIDCIYSKYNQNYNRYTENYKSTLENAFNNLKIDNLICRANGGTLNDSIQEDIDDIIIKVKNYRDNLNNLKYLEFLSEEKKTVVFVGANGCGKTTLLRELIKTTGESKIGYYPADRLMIVDETYNPERSFDNFTKSYIDTDKQASDITNNSQAYNIGHQFNQSIALFEKYRFKEMDAESNREKHLTKKILDIWNDLVKDRVLFSNGGLAVKTLEGEEYSIKYLSSGEKSIFYFLTCILLKEKKEYYFIDEPENNLNPSIVSKLWDIIEDNCPNSIFVYLTHDSNFVSSRVNSNLYWIKKYDGKNWDFENLQENDNLPQTLMINLVGNRNPVIFCESHDEFKYDDILFKLMFPEFSIVPAGGCESLISKVKAYKCVGLPQKAFGIIDCDYKSDSYLEGQEKYNIYHLNFFEIENFLMCEEIVKIVLFEYSVNPEEAFNNLKTQLKKELISTKEIWIIRKIAFELRDKFFNKKVKDITSINELKLRYNEFNDQIDIYEMYSENEKIIDDAINSNDYNKYLRYFDNKGMFSKFQKIMELRDNLNYEEVVFEYLKTHKEKIEDLRKKYFPNIKL